MKLIAIAVLSMVLGVGATTHTGAVASRGASPQIVGVLTAMSSHAARTMLALRGTDSTMRYVPIAASRPIVDGNGGQLALSDLRLGDRIAVPRSGAVTDESDRAVALTGVVAYAPTTVNDVMTLQLSPARSVMVDVDDGTHFLDRAQPSASLSDIVDSDTVAVHGILDTALDEVVESQSVERLGPKLTKSYTAH
jgi:hypothetical protein